MNEHEKSDALRTEYLAAMTELSGLAVDRASHVPGDMGMNALRSSQERDESNKAIIKITRMIADVCNRARAIEQRSKSMIGVPTLFEADVPNAIRVALAILVGKSFSGSWQHECRYVGTMLLPSAGGDINDTLTVREAFRRNGLLRPHILCEPGRTIEEIGNLAMNERSFRRFLALEPDSECEELVNARMLVALNGRR